MVVVDQQNGLAAPSIWVEFGHVNLDGDAIKRVAACQIVDGEDEPILTPDGWEYEGSLSQTYGFAPTEHVDKSLNG